MVNNRTFDRSAPLQFLTWLCRRYAVGTYLHFIPGMANRETHLQSRQAKAHLLEEMRNRDSAVFVETMISPSYRTALAQSLQVPGVSGVENNAAMFEFSLADGDDIVEEVVEGCALSWAMGMDTLVLRHGECFFGARKQVHLWLTWHDYRNANAMILFAYILLGHPDWRGAELHIFAAFPEERTIDDAARLVEMAESGRIPVAPRNIEVISTGADIDFDGLVVQKSARADLLIRGFTEQKLREQGTAFFRRLPELRDVLFVCARQPVEME